MRIKSSATSAPTTTYCRERLDGPDGRHLWIDGNGKVTAGNGTLDEPKPNAFSLLHIEDCPGSTPTCRASCYVHGLKANAADTYTLAGHNSATIRSILTDAAAAADWVCEWAPGSKRTHAAGSGGTSAGMSSR